MRKLCVELEVSWLCWSEVKLNHILKTEDDKSFKDSLAKKILIPTLKTRTSSNLQPKVEEKLYIFS